MFHFIQRVAVASHSQLAEGELSAENLSHQISRISGVVFFQQIGAVDSTVRELMSRASPISLLESPTKTAANTACSLGVNFTSAGNDFGRRLGAPLRLPIS